MASNAGWIERTGRRSPGRQGPPPAAAAASAGHILVVDDEADVRRLLRRCLELSLYTVEECGSAEEALHRIHGDTHDLVLLDLNLPGRSGHEVLENIRRNPATRLLPVVVLTGMATREEKIRAIDEGATDFLAKPFAPEELIPRVRSLVLLKRFADEHEHVEQVLLTLVRTIDARDAYTAGHSERVAGYAARVGARMGFDSASLLEMRRGALFHDLGKIVVPDAVLGKPGPLTPEERKVIEQHPVAGFDVLSPMRTMRGALPIVYHHHERLDGSGYPDGISGSGIAMPIRIVTVVDIFDALTTTRAYRKALTAETAFEILEEEVGKGWWDGEVVDELRGVIAVSGVMGERTAGA